MVARTPDTRQRRAGVGNRVSTRVESAGRRAAVHWSAPGLRRLLFDPESPVLSWSSPDGAAEVIYHPAGDYWSWTVAGVAGASDLSEDVLDALAGRPVTLRVVNR